MRFTHLVLARCEAGKLVGTVDVRRRERHTRRYTTDHAEQRHRFSADARLGAALHSIVPSTATRPFVDIHNAAETTQQFGEVVLRRDGIGRRKDDAVDDVVRTGRTTTRCTGSVDAVDVGGRLRFDHTIAAQKLQAVEAVSPASVRRGLAQARRRAADNSEERNRCACDGRFGAILETVVAGSAALAFVFEHDPADRPGEFAEVVVRATGIGCNRDAGNRVVLRCGTTTRRARRVLAVGVEHGLRFADVVVSGYKSGEAVAAVDTGRLREGQGARREDEGDALNCGFRGIEHAVVVGIDVYETAEIGRDEQLAEVVLWRYPADGDGDSTDRVVLRCRAAAGCPRCIEAVV